MNSNFLYILLMGVSMVMALRMPGLVMDGVMMVSGDMIFNVPNTVLIVVIVVMSI